MKSQIMYMKLSLLNSASSHEDDLTRQFLKGVIGNGWKRYGYTTYFKVSSHSE